MPQGKGTYGSKVGRPPKKKTASKKKTVRKSASSVSNADLRKRAGASSVSNKDVAMARSKKKVTRKKAASKKKTAKKMTASQRAAYEFGKAAMPSKKRSSRKMTPALSDRDRAIALAKKQDSRNPASPYLVSDKDFKIAQLKKRSPKKRRK